MKNLFRIFIILIIFIFSAGIIPSNLSSVADAKAKKKTVRKVPRKKTKKVKKVKYKKAKKAKKGKKTKISNKAKPKPTTKPKASGKVSSLNYYLEEGVDDAEAEKIVSTLREMGVEDASIDVDNNTLAVKFDSGKVSAASLVSKLKGLGYTATKVL